MKTSVKRFLASVALAVMAVGFGVSVEKAWDATQTANAAQRLYVDGDIGDGTSPNKKG